MKRVLVSILLGMAAGCARLEPRPPASAPDWGARLRARSYSAEQLGITVTGTRPNQTVRWKETIRPNTPVQVPLVGDSGQPRFEAVLNDGTPVHVSIDTGAGLNVFNAPEALAAGIKIADPDQFGNVFQGLGGQEFSWYGMLDRVTVGSLSIQNLFCVVRVPQERREYSLDNVFGLTTLAKFASVTIDYPEGAATFALEGNFVPPSHAVAKADLTLRSLQLMIDVQINAIFEITVLLDTGNDAALMLTESMIEELGLAAAARNGRKGRFAGIGGVIETRTFTLDSISIGGTKFTGIEATVVPDDFPPSLGSGFLRQFKTTIDFSARKLWLEH